MKTPTHRPLIVAVLALAAWTAAFPLLGGRGKLFDEDFVALAGLSGNEAITYVAVGVVQLFVVAGLGVWIAARWGSGLDAAARALLAKNRASLAAIALAGGAVAFALSIAVIHQHTITEDEKTYLFQAKLLLLGKLSIAVPEGASAFHEPFLVAANGHWSGQYFWAQSALLAVGLVAHAPYLVPALEVACTAYFTGLLAEEAAGDRRAGLLAAALAASSPIAVMTGATLHDVNLSAACIAVTLWAVARLHRGPDRAATWALGLATGIELHNRPFDDVAILGGVVCVLVAIRDERGARLEMARRLAPAVATALPFVVLHAVLNDAVTGDWRHSGYWLHYRGHDWETFGLVTGPGGFENSGMAAFAKTITNVARMFFYAAGGPLAFVPVAALAVAGRAGGVLRAAGWIALVYYAAYFFYAAAPIQTTGPVYFDTLVPVLATAIAVGAVEVHDVLARRDTLRRLVPALVVAQMAAGVVVFWPPALSEMDRASRDSSACDDLTAQHLPPTERALVFVAKSVAFGSFTFWHPMPSPQLDDRVLFPQSRGAAIDADVVAKLGAGRRVYLAHCVGEPVPRIEPYEPSRAVAP